MQAPNVLASTWNFHQLISYWNFHQLISYWFCKQDPTYLALFYSYPWNLQWIQHDYNWNCLSQLQHDFFRGWIFFFLTTGSKFFPLKFYIVDPKYHQIYILFYMYYKNILKLNILFFYKFYYLPYYESRYITWQCWLIKSTLTD